MDISHIKSLLDEIISSSTPDTIDIGLVSSIISKPLSNSEQKEIFRHIVHQMRIKPENGLVCVSLIQLINSISYGDWALMQLCTDEFDDDIRSIIKNSRSKPFIYELLRFIQDLAIEHQNNVKYRKLILLYNELRHDGYEFPKTFSNKTLPLGDDTNTSLQADSVNADMELAIKLSLEQSEKDNIKNIKKTSIPSAPMSAQAQFKNIVAKVLYDFNAEEPGELSIKAGNTLTILERCNESWWKGQIDGNVGLFPANFVSFDMSIPIPTKIGNKCKVDDALMTECLQRLLSANPVYPQDDEFEIISLEKTCKKMKIEVINKIEELKLKESKYLESDRLYNDTIISYKQLIDDSRKQPMIGYNQPMNTQSNAPMYTNQEQYPQQSYSMADYPQNMPFNPLYSNQQYQYPPTQPNLLPNMSLPPNTSPSYYNKDYTYHQ